MGMFRKSQISIIFPQLQTVFCPTGKHPVRLCNPPCHQIIHHDPQVSLMAQGRPSITVTGGTRRIESGKQSLCCSLFVPRGPIDLTGKIQTA